MSAFDETIRKALDRRRPNINLMPYYVSSRLSRFGVDMDQVSAPDMSMILYPAYYDHVTIDLGRDYFNENRRRQLLPKNSGFETKLELKVKYAPVSNGFMDKVGVYYSNIIFVKTQLLNGFTHILAYTINPAKAEVERAFVYARASGVSLEGFYPIKDSNINAVQCGLNCVKIKHSWYFHMLEDRVKISDGTRLDNFYEQT